MNSRFQEIYIHHNLFRPDNHKCSCDEFTCSQDTSEKCYCVPKHILEVTNCIFDLKSTTKSKCRRFGMANIEAVKKEIGFSIHQLNNFDKIENKRDVEDLRKEILVDDASLKDYVVLLCAHFNTIILTTGSISNASNISSIYSTMLCDIYEAYDRINSNNSLLMEIYFYICFCTRGTRTFNATEIVELYKIIKTYDETAARNIHQNLNDFENYCNGNYNFLSTILPYLENHNSNNYLACIFQLFLNLTTKYQYAFYKTESKDKRFEVLNCDYFLLLIERINTAFSHERSHHDLSSECLIERINQVK